MPNGMRPPLSWLTLAPPGVRTTPAQLKQSLAPLKNNLDSLFEQVNTVVAQGPQLAFPVRR